MVFGVGDVGERVRDARHSCFCFIELADEERLREAAQRGIVELAEIADFFELGAARIPYIFWSMVG